MPKAPKIGDLRSISIHDKITRQRCYENETIDEYSISGSQKIWRRISGVFFMSRDELRLYRTKVMPLVDTFHL